MFKPPPISDQMENNDEEEDVVQQQQHQYYHQPIGFQKHDEFMDGISKQTLIIIFVAFIAGMLLGKSLTPIVLRQ